MFNDFRLIGPWSIPGIVFPFLCICQKLCKLPGFLAKNLSDADALGAGLRRLNPRCGMKHESHDEALEFVRCGVLMLHNPMVIGRVRRSALGIVVVAWDPRSTCTRQGSGWEEAFLQHSVDVLGNSWKFPERYVVLLRESACL